MIIMMGIYYIKNLTNNKIYIGQSVDILKRFNTHKHRLRNNAHENPHLQSSFNKYGEKNFEFGLIKSTKERYLNRLEKLFIKKYDSTNPNNGYNIAKGGNSNSGWIAPPEVRAKMSKSHKGRKHYPMTDETKQKISNSLKGNIPWNKGKSCPQLQGSNHPMYGKHHSEKSKQMISESKKGQTLSDETKQLLSEIRSKYNIWDYSKVKYDKYIMFQRNRTPNPCKCFKLVYDKQRIEIGRFIDFVTVEIINELIKESI